MEYTDQKPQKASGHQIRFTSSAVSCAMGTCPVLEIPEPPEDSGQVMKLDDKNDRYVFAWNIVQRLQYKRQPKVRAVDDVFWDRRTYLFLGVRVDTNLILVYRPVEVDRGNWTSDVVKQEAKMAMAQFACEEENSYTFMYWSGLRQNNVIVKFPLYIKPQNIWLYDVFGGAGGQEPDGDQRDFSHIIKLPLP